MHRWLFLVQTDVVDGECGYYRWPPAIGEEACTDLYVS
jgi:hypothetical protein